MTEETRKPRCAECGHKQESHFCCEVGSFCEECPNDEDNTWEHVFAADAKREEPRMQRIDGKFSTDGLRIFNTVSGEEIPKDEPLFLLRARDHYALVAIDAYQGATEGE